MAAARRRRTYESPLRAEQMDRTRDKLIEAGVDLVAEGLVDDVTVRSVAARAQVSVPTAYRYFPDRDALLEGIAASVSAKIVGAQVPSTADDLPAWGHAIYRGFDENDRFIRAQLHTSAGRAIRARSQKGRNQAVLAIVKRSFPSASPAMQKRLSAVMRVLVNIHAWVALNDDWGMSGDEAGRLIAWAMGTLVAEAKRRPAALDFDRRGPQ